MTHQEIVQHLSAQLTNSYRQQESSMHGPFNVIADLIHNRSAEKSMPYFCPAAHLRINYIATFRHYIDQDA